MTIEFRDERLKLIASFSREDQQIPIPRDGEFVEVNISSEYAEHLGTVTGLMGYWVSSVSYLYEDEFTVTVVCRK